jgi:hypothetical protein
MFLSDAIKEKRVFGTFFKYLYQNNEERSIVYCRNKYQFLKLLAQWNSQSKAFCESKYLYTEVTPEDDIPMSPQEIHSERLLNNRGYLSMFICDPYTHVEYIQ